MSAADPPFEPSRLRDVELRNRIVMALRVARLLAGRRAVRLHGRVLRASRERRSRIDRHRVPRGRSSPSLGDTRLTAWIAAPPVVAVHVCVSVQPSAWKLCARSALPSGRPGPCSASRNGSCRTTARVWRTRPEELSELLGVLSDAGVDVFDASARRFGDAAFEGSDLTLAGWARKLTGKPTMAIGGIGLAKDLQSSFVDGSDAENNLDEVSHRRWPRTAGRSAMGAQGALRRTLRALRRGRVPYQDAKTRPASGEMTA